MAWVRLIAVPLTDASGSLTLFQKALTHTTIRCNIAVSRVCKEVNRDLARRARTALQEAVITAERLNCG